jgi:hypothetical protein
MVSLAIMLGPIDMFAGPLSHVFKVAAFPPIEMAICMRPAGKLADVALFLFELHQLMAGNFATPDTLGNPFLLVDFRGVRGGDRLSRCRDEENETEGGKTQGGRQHSFFHDGISFRGKMFRLPFQTGIPLGGLLPVKKSDDGLPITADKVESRRAFQKWKEPG